MAAYQIIIADDHPLFRSALQQALTVGLGENVHLVEAASIAELEGFLTQSADWDLVLLDLNMPGAYGFSGLVLLRGQYPHLPVVMISAQEDAAVVARSREFGASGFIPKSSSLETIQEAVRAVLDGDVWWPSNIQDVANVSDEAKAASAGLASLTPQQFRVLTMVCDGLLNKQIAYELNVSERPSRPMSPRSSVSSACAPGPRQRCCCSRWGPSPPAEPAAPPALQAIGGSCIWSLRRIPEVSARHCSTNSSIAAVWYLCECQMK